MNIPLDLNKWDYSTIYNLVAEHDAEPGLYDFKEVLNGRGTEKNQAQVLESIRKTACSLANSDGGYIIFGVKDKARNPTLSVDQLIVGIPNSPENLKTLGNKLVAIQPNISCVHRDTLIDLPGNNNTAGIFVVYVPLSPRRPHMFQGIFYKRLNTGSAEPMDRYEVRDQMLYTEGRLQKVRLLRLKIAQFNMLRSMQVGYGIMYEWQEELAKHLRYDTSEFEALVADICDMIPNQTKLLQKLLDLSKTAVILNAALNPTNHFSRNNRSIVLGEEGNLLADLCEKCEKQLTEIFDPLTTDKTDV